MSHFIDFDLIRFRSFDVVFVPLCESFSFSLFVSIVSRETLCTIYFPIERYIISMQRKSVLTPLHVTIYVEKYIAWNIHFMKNIPKENENECSL